jgi:hypothetical protein
MLALLLCAQTEHLSRLARHCSMLTPDSCTITADKTVLIQLFWSVTVNASQLALNASQL